MRVRFEDHIRRTWLVRVASEHGRGIDFGILFNRREFQVGNADGVLVRGGDRVQFDIQITSHHEHRRGEVAFRDKVHFRVREIAEPALGRRRRSSYQRNRNRSE